MGRGRNRAPEAGGTLGVTGVAVNDLGDDLPLDAVTGWTVLDDSTSASSLLAPHAATLRTNKRAGARRRMEVGRPWAAGGSPVLPL